MGKRGTKGFGEKNLQKIETVKLKAGSEDAEDYASSLVTSWL
jgi:hypothetical protein